MREGRYSEAQAARLVREVLRCVAQAHAKHIMIRDVKPQNVGSGGGAPNERAEAHFDQRALLPTAAAGLILAEGAEVELGRGSAPPGWRCGTPALLLACARALH